MQLKSFAQSEVLDRPAMQADLNFLHQELKRYHPNLYTYATPAAVDEWFRQQDSLLEDDINPQQAYLLVTSFSKILKDGHSYIYPSAGHLERFYQSAPLFPLDVFLLDEKLVVTGNFSNEQNIPAGAEIVAINGIGLSDILSVILPRMPMDGDNPGYGAHLFYRFFPAYYSFFYSFPTAFDIVFTDQQGDSKKVRIQGVSRDKIRERRHQYQTKKEAGIDLQIDESNQLAVLTIRAFDNDILKSEYDTRFKREIRNSFDAIAKHNIQHLAIDLRGNQGGELSNGVYLLQHFMTEAFKCVDSYQVIRHNKTTDRQPKQLKNRWDNYFKPRKRNHYNGNVYVFLNGGSFSCSAIVSNAIKTNERGTIMGQMSGGSAYINSGGPNKVITLPNSKISFTIPRTQYNLRTDPAVIGLGVSPDIEVPDHPSRFLDGPDPYLEKLRELIGK
jgi:hypothetical protein